MADVPKIYDEETGLIYLRNRYYDPKTGRFITEDSVMDGLNWYVYCGNNPVKLIDPNGLDAVLITSDDSAGSSGMYFGHTSVLIEDGSGQWWYYYWGNTTAAYIPIPYENMNTIDDLNEWLKPLSETKDGVLEGTTINYNHASYIRGDFTESHEFFKNLVENTDIGEKEEYGAMGLMPNTIKGNFDYGIVTNNCVITTINGLKKGTMITGYSYSAVIKENTIFPKVYRDIVKDKVKNSSFKKTVNY